MAEISPVDNMHAEELAALLEWVSTKFYESLAMMHEDLALRIGSRAADDIIIKAMAVNLGHVIGQTDPKRQKKYASIARQAIKEHMLAGTMLKDQHAHGVIGHA